MYSKGIFARTKRLVLRPMALKDFKAWQKFCLDQQPPKNEWDRKYRMFKEANLKEFRTLLAKYKKLAKLDRTYSFAVFTKNGTMIGEACVMNIDRGAFQCGMVGCVLSNLYWNAGYGRETLHALIKNSFLKLKLHRVEGLVERHNRRSIRMLKAVGMRREGLSRKNVYVDSKWTDAIRYSNICEDYGIRWKP